LVSQEIINTLNTVVAEAMKKEAAIHLMVENRGKEPRRYIPSRSRLGSLFPGQQGGKFSRRIEGEFHWFAADRMIEGKV